MTTVVGGGIIYLEINKGGKNMKNKSISFVIIGILLLLVPVMFFLTSSGIKNAGLVVNTNELNTTWYYVNEEGAETPIQMESKYDCKVNEEFIIYTHINEENDYNTLLIESSQQRIKVFLDEELLFDNSTEESRLFGKAEQSKFNLVSLPHGIEGKTIKISLIKFRKNNFFTKEIQSLYVLSILIGQFVIRQNKYCDKRYSLSPVHLINLPTHSPPLQGLFAQ